MPYLFQSLWLQKLEVSTVHSEKIPSLFVNIFFIFGFLCDRLLPWSPVNENNNNMWFIKNFVHFVVRGTSVGIYMSLDTSNVSTEIIT